MERRSARPDIDLLHPRSSPPSRRRAAAVRDLAGLGARDAGQRGAHAGHRRAGQGGAARRRPVHQGAQRKPRCYGACAKAWPPLVVEGQPQAARTAPTRRSAPRASWRAAPAHVRRPPRLRPSPSTGRAGSSAGVAAFGATSAAVTLPELVAGDVDSARGARPRQPRCSAATKRRRPRAPGARAPAAPDARRRPTADRAETATRPPHRRRRPRPPSAARRSPTAPATACVPPASTAATPIAVQRRLTIVPNTGTMAAADALSPFPSRSSARSSTARARRPLRARRAAAHRSARWRRSWA